MSTFKKVYSFKDCTWNTVREYALDILPHMRKDVLSGLVIVRWQDGLPVVRASYGSLSGLNDWAGDNFNYCFDILWDGN